MKPAKSVDDGSAGSYQGASSVSGSVYGSSPRTSVRPVQPQSRIDACVGARLACA
ncbi:hypothetical protein ACFSKW_39510 [Nonomuraea mangrovi]|uniref:Uncharacterized protein n=2 Tax=Streptosporangiaceae TaxID=2004 RepID=A0ABW4T861_9ACTN